MAGRFLLPRATAFDANGDPISGAKLEFFESGTSTQQNTFSDDALTTPNTNPVIADSAGRFGDIFLITADYKVTLSDADDNVIWTADPVRSESPKSTVVVSATTTTTLDASNDGNFIAADATAGAFIITLPAAATAGDGYEVTIMKIDSSSNIVTVDGDGAETINDLSDLDFPDQFSAAIFRCDGSEWFAYAITQTTATRILPPGFLDGFAVTNNSSDSEHDIDVATGTARSDADNGNVILSIAITKRIDAAFAEGTNQGGLDTGTVAADTVYFIWGISKTDGTADVLFSLSSTSPTMPSGFTLKVLLDRVKTDSSSNIINNVFYPELRTKEGPDWTTIGLAAAFPAATSDEKQTPFLEQWDEIVFFFSLMSGGSNARIDLQIGDATDYTTGMTYQGSTVDESGVTVDNWTSNTAVSLGTNAAASQMSGRAIFRRIPDADAVTIFGASNIGWQVDVLLEPNSGSSDRIHGSGMVGTTKTPDRTQISPAAGSFDNGTWGVMAR